MYDIEVIDNRNYAVITAGSPAYEFLKAMNSKMVMKRLASEPGAPVGLTATEIAPLCKGFRVQDLKRLIDVDLLFYDTSLKAVTNENGYTDVFNVNLYTFTEYGLEIVDYIKRTGDDVEIRLN